MVTEVFTFFFLDMCLKNKMDLIALNFVITSNFEFDSILDAAPKRTSTGVTLNILEMKERLITLV